MELVHRFSVPASIDEAWTALTHLERIAPCIPGATLTSIEGSVFTGAMKVKFGPAALVYNGTGTFLHRSDRAHRATVETHGSDRRGNGTATATVHLVLHANGGRTDVDVKTDLALTGRAAQLGRGVVCDVTDRLVDQFVDCLTPKFAQGIGSAMYDGPVDGQVPVTTGAQTGDRDLPAIGYSPPGDTSRTHVDMVARAASAALRQYGPYLAAGLAFVWIAYRVVRSARRKPA